MEDSHDHDDEGSEFLKLPGSDRRLGRFFFNIGRVYMYTFTSGGLYGVYEGLRFGQRGSFKMAMNSIFNSVGTRSITTANYTAASAAFYYAFRVMANKFRGLPQNQYDPASSILAGTSAGMLFRVLKGPREMIVYGGIGLFLTSLHAFYRSEYNPYKRKRRIIHL